MTIALVGDVLGKTACSAFASTGPARLLNQADLGLWFNLVKREYKWLFPVLPNDTRYYEMPPGYRVFNKLERIWADFALLLTAQHEVLAYSIDSKLLPLCEVRSNVIVGLGR